MSNLNGASILQQLQALRKEWHSQNLRFTREQQERYDTLTQHRRNRVAQLREEGRVWVGPSNVGVTPKEDV